VARTRAQRRRHSLFLTIALVVTLVVLVFARDIARSAHGAITNQRSENRSFAALANTLIVQENDFDAAHGSTAGKRRDVVATGLRRRASTNSTTSWYLSTSAELLRRPKLAHDITTRSPTSRKRGLTTTRRCSEDRARPHDAGASPSFNGPSSPDRPLAQRVGADVEPQIDSRSVT